MRFYTHNHKYYCGIDLHTSVMYVCITDEAGTILVHKNLKTDPEAFVRVVEPYRDDLAVSVECVFVWYGITDRFEDPMVAASIQIDSNLLDSLHQQILFVERRITEQAREHDPIGVQLLRTIPGIGKLLELTIHYEIGDIARFHQVGNFIAYARLVKRAH